MKVRIHVLILGMMLLVLFSNGWTEDREALVSQKIASFLQQFPAQNAVDLDRLASEILDFGPDGILSICRMLVPSGAGDDSRVRFALGGITTYVSREGMEKNRRLYARTLIKVLKTDVPDEVKAFVVRQLQLCGGDESVAALKKYLTDRRLCGPAVSALLAVGSAEAERALLRSLHSVGPSNRISVIKALGEMKSRRAVKKIIRLASGGDRDLHNISLFALANTGDPRAEGLLSRFAVATSPYERAQAPTLYLLYAQRLAESGEKARCVRICREFIKSYMSPEETQIACAALETLVDVLGDGGLVDLFAALDSPEKEFRMKALALADRYPGLETTAEWVKRSDALPPRVKAEVIDMLGRRGDKSVLPALIEELQSEESAVRASAITACARLEKEAVLPQLWPLLQTESREEIEALRNALFGFPSPLVVPEAARRMEDVPQPARIVLIDLLAERRARQHVEMVLAETESENQALREAALSALESLSREQDLPRLIEMLQRTSENKEILLLQNAIVSSASQIENPEERCDLVLAALDSGEDRRRSDLLRILPRIGGIKALQVVIQEMESVDPRVRSVAVSTLSRWPDIDALEPLRRIINTTENPTHRYVALQGVVRLLELEDWAPSVKISELQTVFSSSVEPADKRVLLSGLAGIKSEESLRLVVPFLEDLELRPEALRAVARIALPEEEGEQGLFGECVESVLEKTARLAEDASLRDRIRAYLAVLWELDGFRSLYNGIDLTGWIGNTEGYEADEEKIVVHPEKGGGNLYTEKEYNDFILRFEFKLTPGANNGLGIRTPLEGDAAYVGLELQILDNTAEKYQDLKPYQYHGSVYGVVPAKRGYLNPVGEWNDQEVVVKGSRITVKLNGTIILDADILEAGRNGTLDGRDHPGLKRDRGHIGFLGHGSRLEFRNLWIKELK